MMDLMGLANPQIRPKDLELRREVVRVRDKEQAPSVAVGAVVKEVTRSKAVSLRTQRRGCKNGSLLHSDEAFGFEIRNQRKSSMR